MSGKQALGRGGGRSCHFGESFVNGSGKIGPRREIGENLVLLIDL